MLAEAPLQVYSSALVFAPETSVVRRTFISQVPQAVQMVLGRDTAWDACRSVLVGHTDDINAVVFSADGQLLALASDDKTVRVWETATGACRSVLEGHTNSVSAVVFSTDGQLLASASDDKTVRVWETATGACRSVLKCQSPYIRHLTFSLDGRALRTDKGDVSLPPNLYSAPSLTEEEESSQLAVEGQWVLHSTQRLLLLPFEY
jgi:WD40 repeat protein